MAVIHIPQQRRFTAVSNELARSRAVSLPAKGLMLYLLSHTDNWQVTAHDIETTHNIGRDARQRLYRELETAGYLSARRTQNEKGHWSFDIDAHEEPLAPENRTSLLGATKPEVLNRVPENPVAGGAGGRETRSYTKDQIVPNTDLLNTEREREHAFSLTSQTQPSSHTPTVDELTQPDDSGADWMTLEKQAARYVLKVCGLWDEDAREPMPMAPLKYQGVMTVAAWLNKHNRLQKAGHPDRFLEYWRERGRRGEVWPLNISENWTPFQVWLTGERETVAA